jgi:acetyl esterase
MCEELGLVILVPDYRKAPEHPYPAPLDDCEAAAAWMEANAVKEFGAAAGKVLIMGGESAGVGLYKLNSVYQ